MNKLYENMPNVAPEGPLRNDRKGPLSIIGDPLGKGLEKGLAPVGYVVGKVGEPNGQAMMDVQKQMKEENGYGDKMQSVTTGPGGEGVGGQDQTAKNPLGL